MGDLSPLLASMTLLLALAGCADDAGTDDGPTEAPEASADPHAGHNLTLSASAEGLYPANPTLSPATLDGEAGATVTLDFTNNDQNPLVGHNWVLEGVEGAATDTVQPGESTDVTFQLPLEPGDYTFYCSIGDHRDRGMEGVLHVA